MAVHGKGPLQEGSEGTDVFYSPLERDQIDRQTRALQDYNNEMMNRTNNYKLGSPVGKYPPLTPTTPHDNVAMAFQ